MCFSPGKLWDLTEKKVQKIAEHVTRGEKTPEKKIFSHVTREKKKSKKVFQNCLRHDVN